MKVYKVKSAYAYGDEKDAILAKQAAMREKYGLTAVENEVYCTAEEALALLVDGYSGIYVDLASMPKLVFEKTQAGALSPEFPIKKLFNHKCQQEQPNPALLRVGKVKVLQDTCTDLLQTNLDNNWRILAIQPQPDQRRPDYILGQAEF